MGHRAARPRVRGRPGCRRRRRDHLGRAQGEAARRSTPTRWRGSLCAPTASPASSTPTEHLVDDHTDGAYAVLRFDAECEAASYAQALEVDYSLFFDLDPTHRGLLRVERGKDSTRPASSSPDRPRLRLGAEEPLARWSSSRLRARRRLAHLDRLRPHPVPVSLLLPSVFILRRTPWAPAEPLPRHVLGRLPGRDLVHDRALDHAVARRAVGDRSCLRAWSSRPSRCRWCWPR